MTKPLTIQLECPNCGNTFEDIYAAVLYLRGSGFRADFKPGYETDVPLSELLLYQCTVCGFTERSILDRFENSISDDLRFFINNSLPELKQEFQSNQKTDNYASKFINYAHILEFRGSRAIDIGKAYLRASWVDNSEMLQEKALEKFNEAMKQTDMIGIIEGPLAAYLGGELARRLRKFTMADRLFSTSLNLTRRSLESAVRTYGVLNNMVHQQSDSPKEEVEWDFSEGLVLDPLDYYHAKTLYLAATNVRYERKSDALKLYLRSFDICQPALERSISTKSPQFNSIEQNDYFVKQMAALSNSRSSTGFWVDDCLVIHGYKSLTEINELKSLSTNSEDIMKIDAAIRNFNAPMKEFEAEISSLSEKQLKSGESRLDEKFIVKFWNGFFFIFQLLIFSLITSGLAYWGLQQIKIETNYLLLAGATIAAWLSWAFVQSVLTSFTNFIFAMFKRDSHRYIMPIAAIIGFIVGVLLAIFVAGWPALISILFTAGLMLLLNRVIK